MTNEEYAELALRTAPTDVNIDPKQFNLLLGAIGLGGEAGELLEIIKKHVFHGHPLTDETRAKVLKEMGDVEWYLNLLRTEFNMTLEEVHEANIAKLAARYPEGFFTSERSITRAAGDE